MGISLPTLALSLTLAAPAEIVFNADGGLYSLKADGSGKTLLVAAPKGQSVGDAAWSPDGARLVYSQGDEDTSRLLLKDAAGTHPVTTPPADASDFAPTWSPDGHTLAFTRFTLTEERLTTQIITRDLATGAERVLVTQDGRVLDAVTAPVYSPDGATIAYTFNRYDRNADSLPEVRTIPAQGGPAKTLIKQAQGLTYSPDGTRVAYASIADHHGKQCGSDQCWWAGELYVANADGSQPRRLTEDEGDMSFPYWSPDGSRILFSSDRALPDADSDELYSIAPDGSCFTWLTNGVPASRNPAWRPASGDSYTADCDPRRRPVTYTPPRTTRFHGNLWLGAKHEGLLLTQATSGALHYRDCERFRGCRREVSINVSNPCKRLYTPNYELRVQRGWLTADYGLGEDWRVVFAGARETLVPPRVIGDLRVLKRQKARIPRAFLAHLTAAQKAKLKPYRSC